MQDIDLSTAVAHSLAKYRNHLEFMGYNIEEEAEDWLFGRHPRKVNLGLKKISNRGVLISTVFGLKENLNRSNILEFANTLNAELFFMKAYLTQEGSLRLETFFEGEYDRSNFSLLLENIDCDIDVFFNHDLTDSFF
jgi:hypothetical protein